MIESSPPTRLVTTWSPPDGDGSERPSRATFVIEPYGEIVRLTVIHQDLSAGERADVGAGWPAVLSNLKSYLETGTRCRRCRGPCLGADHGPMGSAP